MQKEYQNANKILNNIVVSDNSRCSRVYFDNNKRIQWKKKSAATQQEEIEEKSREKKWYQK